MAVRWSGLGMNYGGYFGTNGGYYTGNGILTAKVTSELNIIKNTLGITKLRINIPDFSAQVNNSSAYIGHQNLVLLALSMGFYVIWGVSSNPTVLTSTNWSDFSTSVQAVATWAQANCAAYAGMFELCIGNEEENHKDGTLSLQEVRDNLRTLATACQTIYTAGPISTAIAQGKEDGWITTDSANKGDLDKLSINVYGHSGTFASFQTIINAMYAAFGANTYISEFNLHSTWASSTADGLTPGVYGFENSYKSELIRRINFIQQSGMPSAYFFTFNTSGDTFSCYKADSTYRPAFEAFNTNRSFVVER